MKKALLALCAIILAACTTPPAPTVKALRVEGTSLVDEDGTPVVFRGISFGWHNIWPRFYNADAVKTLSGDWGCRIFRVAIGADDIAKSDNPDCHGGYMGEPEFALRCAYDVIDAAVANGCYVIVDWHSHVIHTEEAKAFFSAVATKYKGVPNVIYELFNEPVCFSFENGSGDRYADLGNPEAMAAYWKALKTYAQELIATITAIDGSEPLILMGCPAWDQRIDLPAADPVEGYANLMYTMHFYAATHGAWLRDATDAAIAAGIPVFISECAGCEASGDGFLDLDAWKAYSDWATEKGISMLTWSVSDKQETCSMLTPAASSGGPWAEDVIKDWGKVVKAWLTEK
jgi:endoglucanase